MRLIFDINDVNRIEVTEFQDSLDLSIHFKQPRGEWICTGAVVIPPDKAKMLAIALINALPEPADVLKVKHLTERNQETAREARRPVARAAAEPKTLAEVLG